MSASGRQGQHLWFPTVSPTPSTVPATSQYLWSDRGCRSRREQHWRRGEEGQQEEGRGMGGKNGKRSPFSQSRWKTSLLPQNWHTGGRFLPDILNTGIKINTYPNFFLCILSLSIERPTLKNYLIALTYGKQTCLIIYYEN